MSQILTSYVFRNSTNFLWNFFYTAKFTLLPYTFFYSDTFFYIVSTMSILVETFIRLVKSPYYLHGPSVFIKLNQEDNIIRFNHHSFVLVKKTAFLNLNTWVYSVPTESSHSYWLLIFHGNRAMITQKRHKHTLGMTISYSLRNDYSLCVTEHWGCSPTSVIPSTAITKRDSCHKDKKFFNRPKSVS